MADTQQWVQVDFKADQGSTWRRFLRFMSGASPVDLTGYTIDMQIREGVAASGASAVATLTNRASPAEGAGRISFVGMTGTDPDPDVTADPTNGWIMLLLTDEEMAAIGPSTAKKKNFPLDATYYYDIELTDTAGETQRRVAGEWALSLEVTKV